jgi:hypothetical protein
VVVLWLAAGLGCLVLGWGRPCDGFCPDCCLRHGMDLGVGWRRPEAWGGRFLLTFARFLGRMDDVAVWGSSVCIDRI